MKVVIRYKDGRTEEYQAEQLNTYRRDLTTPLLLCRFRNAYGVVEPYKEIPREQVRSIYIEDL